MALTDDELDRYARHIVLREIGGPGQAALRAASVAVIGAGGLGSPALLYLAAAGIGRLTVIDDDAVSLSNLQRQVLHATGAVGRPKIDSARDALAAVNPGVEVQGVASRRCRIGVMKNIDPVEAKSVAPIAAARIGCGGAPDAACEAMSGAVSIKTACAAWVTSSTPKAVFAARPGAGPSEARPPSATPAMAPTPEQACISPTPAPLSPATRLTMGAT